MYRQAAEYIKTRTNCAPKIGIILGSGLGDIAGMAEDAVIIPYSEIPCFPVSTVHKGNLLIGKLGGTDVVFMQGRVHFYEGYTMEQLAVPIQTLRCIGVETLIITNASGGIKEKYTPGDIVMICDHIKFDLDSPLRGKNPEGLGSRFFDMTTAYTPELRTLAEKIALDLGFTLHKGVYAYMGGPQFETPAEIRMLRSLGADLVGMSTVPEVIAAVHCKMKVLGFSCVTNMAAGMENGGLNQEVITDAEKRVQKNLKNLITRVVERL